MKRCWNMVARLISLPPVCPQCLNIRTHVHHCPLFKTGRKTTLWSIILHKKKFNCSVEVKYVRTFELMLGYTWLPICYAVYKHNLREQVDSCCILFEYSLMHVLIPNEPAKIFRARSFVDTRRAKRRWNFTYHLCGHHYTRFSIKFKSSCTVIQ